MYIGRYWEYLDVQVLVVFLILKLFSESQFYSFTTRLSSSSNKLICAIEQTWIMKSLIWKTWKEKMYI